MYTQEEGKNMPFGEELASYAIACRSCNQITLLMTLLPIENTPHPQEINRILVIHYIQCQF